MSPANKMSADKQEKLEKEIMIEMLMCTKYGWRQHENYQGYQICSVCLDSLHEKYVLELPCEHCYHVDCILLTIADYNFRKCPYCSKEYKQISEK